MRLAVFGAAPDTPNMGVSALFMSVVEGIVRFIDPVEFVVFDNGLGYRESTIEVSSGKQVSVVRFGARGGRRYYRPENLANMLLASSMGKFGSWFNRGIHLLDTCKAVLDVSGGDSFSDIYGLERFDLIYRPKAIAVNRNIPLILMPQTYGPYQAKDVEKKTKSALCMASMVWSRDNRSYEVIKELLGSRFNPKIHCSGVDMAFSLLPRSATELLDQSLIGWLKEKSFDTPLIGFNVSGLIYNDPDGARDNYGFSADYRRVVVEFLSNILNKTNARIVLVSHVMNQPGHFESDLAACNSVIKELSSPHLSRVRVAPANLDQSQVKWLISHMDWFCGTRMHSTIASLSSGIPTATISYSDKAYGVFETCGQESQVYDPRKMPTSEIVRMLELSFNSRLETAKLLVEYLPEVRRLAEQQIMSIASHINLLSAR